MKERLHVFLEVAEKQNFTQAAQALFISQPAVSATIKALELEYGLPLFSRAGGRVELTEAGRVLETYARQILNLESQAMKDISTLAGDLAGRLTIGASTTIAQYILPRIIGKFVLNHPNVSFELVSRNTDEIAHLLQNKKIDVAIVEGEVKSTEFNTSAWLEDELKLNAPAKIELSQQPLQFQDVIKLPLLLREKGCGHRQAQEQAFAKMGVELKDLNVVIELGSTEAIKLACETGLGWAFLSEWSCEKERALGTLQTVKVKDFSIIRRFHILQTRESENNNLVQRFIGFVHKSTPGLTSSLQHSGL